MAEASSRETPIADIGPDLATLMLQMPSSAPDVALFVSLSSTVAASCADLFPPTQLGFLSTRQEHLIQGRLAATNLLRDYDRDYDCEHSCTGMKYSLIADALSTRSLKKLAKLNDTDFNCKDCNISWEAFVGRLVEMMETIPQ